MADHTSDTILIMYCTYACYTTMLNRYAIAIFVGQSNIATSGPHVARPTSAIYRALYLPSGEISTACLLRSLGCCSLCSLAGRNIPVATWPAQPDWMHKNMHSCTCGSRYYMIIGSSRNCAYACMACRGTMQWLCTYTVHIRIII